MEQLINTTTNLSDTKITISSAEVEKIIPIFQEGQFFSKGVKIAKFFYKKRENNEKEEENNIRKPIYIQSPIFGYIKKINIEENSIVLSPCLHEVFYGNLCAKCGYKRTEEEIKKSENYKIYSSLSNDLTFDKNSAKKMEEKVINRYLNKKKLILLLDLDNTILHACAFPLNKEDYNYLKEKYKENISEIGIRNKYDKQRYDKIIIKFRVHLKEFFSSLENKYEIFTYTHGAQEYASSIIQYINNYIYPNSLSTERLICREVNNGIIKNKTIKKVFPTKENMVVIIDDRSDVWKENKENLINVHGYFFFFDEYMNNIKAPFLNYDYDNVLFVILNLLNYIHGEFYDFYERNKLKKSVSIIIKEKLFSVFNNEKFYYLQDEKIAECDKIYLRNNIKIQIKKLGGELIENNEEINKGENSDLIKNINILLIDRYDKDDKLIQLFKKNEKKILFCNYINICFMFYYKIDYDEFEVNDEKEIIKFIDLVSIFNKHKERIIEFYKSKLDKKKEKEKEIENKN